MKEKVIGTKNCKYCNISFSITDEDLDFYRKISPKINWEVFKIPTPSLCPKCRQQRRLTFRNERKLYKRKCDLSWENIISVYSPDKNYKVYKQNYWLWDRWNPLDFWQDYDFNETFFEQFDKLLKKVPHMWTNIFNSENSDFNSFSQNLKNCYLCTRTAHSEKIYYSYLVYDKSINCFDCYNLDHWENCYEVIDSKNCYKTFFSKNCIDSSDLILCNNCNNCSNCFWCTNLNSKKYCFFNEELTSDEYFKRLENINLWSKKELNNFKIKFDINRLKYPVKENTNINSENCTWNNILNSKNLKYCFDCNEVEDGKNLNWSLYWENQYDTDFNYYSKNTLEQISCGTVNTILFSFATFESNHIYYCFNMHNCKDCFWCANMKNKQYCILNKQYTKEDYQKLVSKIIKYMQFTWEWWEFFPSKISPFWYNETVANEYFPLEKEKAKEKWFNRSDYEAPFPKVEKIIPAYKLPDDIKNIPNDILNRAIECEKTKKPFKVIKQELEFYRKYNLSIPRFHPDQRHLDRVKLRNPKELFDRKCCKCWVMIKTTYSLDREEIVCCSKCYKKEVY